MRAVLLSCGVSVRPRPRVFLLLNVDYSLSESHHGKLHTVHVHIKISIL